MGYTNEQIRQNVRAAEARIRSGKLKQNNTNSWLLVTYVTSKGLEPTEENFSQAIVENARALEWDVLPNFLKLQDQNERLIKIEPVSVGAEKRAAIEKAGVARDAKLKADESNLKAARSAVLSYLPVSRQGRVEHGKQAEIQKILNDYLDRQPANVDTSDVLSKVQKYIADKYREAEKAAERV